MNQLFDLDSIISHSEQPIFAVFDTETTGLTVHHQGEIEKQPRVIEFAGIITDGVDILHELEFICDPGIAIDEIITKITGLTNEDLKGRPKFEDFIPRMDDYFGRANIAVAHNLSFDESLLEYDLKRVGLKLDAISFPKYKCCTVEQTIPLFGRRMKLEQLYNMFIGHYEQKHRAMDDILLTHEICKHLGIYKSWNGALK